MSKVLARIRNCEPRLITLQTGQSTDKDGNVTNGEEFQLMPGKPMGPPVDVPPSLLEQRNVKALIENDSIFVVSEGEKIVEPTAPTAPTAPTGEYKDLNKAQLTEQAVELGIKVVDRWTKVQIVEAIEAAKKEQRDMREAYEAMGEEALRELVEEQDLEIAEDATITDIIDAILSADQ